MGAQPSAARPHRPRLIRTAEWAIRQGSPALAPAVLFAELDIEACPDLLAAPALAQQLAPARRAIVALCTIGAALESLAEQRMPNAPLQSMALDALGTAAVEALAARACAHFRNQALRAGRHTSPPLCPGAPGWSVAEGQLQIFHLLDAAAIGVLLTPSAMMIPGKSLSMVIGVAPGTALSAFTGLPLSQDAAADGSPCQGCDRQSNCRYQVAHAG